MKKIALLCLALVLALGALGVGYAMWSDTVTISGSVTTNTVNIGFTEFTCQEMYQYLPWGDDDPFYPGEYEGKDVATCVCNYGPDSYFTDPATGLSGYKVGEVTVTNGYPCYWCFVTFVVKNLGTTPVIIQDWEPVDPTGVLTWDGVDALCNGAGEKILRFRTVNLVGSQLHQGQFDKAEIDVHVEQPAEQDARYSFEIVITAIQWNESPIPGHPPS